jgi:hypothetical protein
MLKPLANRLEARGNADQCGDETEVEWCLVDPAANDEIVALYPLNDEGEAYARKLELAYNSYDVLLESCKKTLNALNNCRPSYLSPGPTELMLCAAIAKAEGKSEVPS